MKFNTPFPQTLSKESDKAARILKSFAKGGGKAIDHVIPRSVLQNAKGFAIFTVFKAGFFFSARAGSGVVVARLPDGTWSPPSAIGTTGIGFGAQLGAEVTDFIVVLNSQTALRSFMSAGSLTLGGNLSIAVGPLGRNGEANGALSTGGTVAAMYSYSKTRGLFGGVSLEGSVMIERQDANAKAYRSDVSAKQILTGRIDKPGWADPLIGTLERLTGTPENRNWVQPGDNGPGYDFTGEPRPYAFGGISSEGTGQSKKSNKKSNKKKASFPPSHWDSDNNDNPFEDEIGPGGPKFEEYTPKGSLTSGASAGFETRFRSTFNANNENRRHPNLTDRSRAGSYNNSTGGFSDEEEFYDEFSNTRIAPNYTGRTNSNSSRAMTPAQTGANSQVGSTPQAIYNTHVRSQSGSGAGFNSTKTNQRAFAAYSYDETQGPIRDLKTGGTGPINRGSVKETPQPGVARAIALFKYDAAESGDLSFTKGEVITVIEMSDSREDWWKGKIGSREGMFPANFVEVI